jgi:hypothetical protein
MKITHRITLRATTGIREALSRLDVSINDGMATFEVDETDPHWAQIVDLARQAKAVDFVSTKATKHERREASWLQMQPTWHHGYPQPDDDGGYLALTYNLSDYCSLCGVGAVQTSPFRFKSKPKWGKKGILQLNWIFDEYFVRPEVWQRVFRPFGIQCRPVLDIKTDAPLSSVVQLQITASVEIVLDADRYPSRLCPGCERRKYLPVVRGCFPPLARDPGGVGMAKTTTFFGDGASAFHAVLVFNPLYLKLEEQAITGASFLSVCEHAT